MSQRRGLLFTTMANHRPVIYSKAGETELHNIEPPRQFQPTQARDPTNTNQNPNIPPPQKTLSQLLDRSTQPIFSVSAIFRMNPGGGGCGACGH